MSAVHAYFYGFAVPGRNLPQWDVSEKFMLEDLARSGLVPADMYAYPQALNIHRNAVAGYVFAYFDQNGTPLADAKAGVTGHMYKIRQKPNDRLSKAELKNFPKYMGPSREVIGEEATIPYVHPMFWSLGGDRVYIIEGEKKAVAFMKRFRLPAIAIAGCDNWRNADPHEAGVHSWFPDVLERKGIPNIVIIPDGDVATNRNINKAYNGLRTQLIRIGYNVDIINFGQLAPSKVDDWIVAHPTEDMSSWPLFDLRELLENRATLVADYDLLHDRNVHGVITQIHANEHNGLVLLRRHPLYRDQYRMNLDTMRVDGVANQDSLPIELAAEMQHVFGIAKFTTALAKKVIHVIANERAYSPRKAWLSGLVWDKQERLYEWMNVCLNADQSAYVREVSIKSLVAAVARTFKPGCIVDYMVILKGPQGVGKSSAIRILFGPDNVVEYVRHGVDGKDTQMVIHAGWCIADEELGMISKSERDKLKAILTIRADSLRLPYAASVERYPRRSVFWGSTNEEEFLQGDTTGHRRFAVVEVPSTVEFALLEEVREQLWAEAVWLYRKGVVDYSNIENTSEHVARYVLADHLVEVVESRLAEWFSGSKGCVVDGSMWIRLSQIAIVCDIDVKNYTLMRRLASVMRSLGWVKVDRSRLPKDGGSNASFTRRK